MSLTLLEALEIVQKPASDSAEGFRAALVCGFTPLHLKTFLDAQVRLELPAKRVAIEGGLFGDLTGSLVRASGRHFDAVAIVTEWPDFDARLGFRSLGSWSPDSFTSILEEVQSRCTALERAIAKLAKDAPIALCLPTLPFPPVSSTSGWTASALELQIHLSIAQLACSVAEIPGVRLLNRQYLDHLSPIAQRYDVDSDLRFGFPYQIGHASVLAQTMSRLLTPEIPKKGVITDLDDTLWKGVLGEDGVDGVSWNLDSMSQMHGAYQRHLQSLADAGILVAIASKNDSLLVQEALQRKDLLLRADSVYPVQANWKPKSESVRRILRAWNVAASDVVFIDDNAMELAEVKVAHPEIECLSFPTDNNAEAVDLLVRLRELFGKTTVLEEDRIRRESLQRSPVLSAEPNDSADIETFLANAEAELTLDFAISPTHPRILELVNKTNQFNLNGKRYGQSAWKLYFENPNAFLVAAEYADKFGPLGRIAVAAGRKVGGVLLIDTWVMSCRAFSRRIEYGHLEGLLRKFEADELEFNFLPTPRNRPFLDFLASVSGKEPAGPIRLAREALLGRMPETFYRLKEVEQG